MQVRIQGRAVGFKAYSNSSKDRPRANEEEAEGLKKKAALWGEGWDEAAGRELKAGLGRWQGREHKEKGAVGSIMEMAEGLERRGGRG